MTHKNGDMVFAEDSQLSFIRTKLGWGTVRQDVNRQLVMANHGSTENVHKSRLDTNSFLKVKTTQTFSVTNHENTIFL